MQARQSLSMVSVPAALLDQRGAARRLRAQLHILLQAAVNCGTCSASEAAGVLRDLGCECRRRPSHSTTRSKKYARSL